VTHTTQRRVMMEHRERPGPWSEQSGDNTQGGGNRLAHGVRKGRAM